MSIIREDENFLEAALWHMERAFEQQPVNRAVQDELRRLFTIRDGAEPVKIRMTKGALIRMYTRGNLLPQAVAKAEAALAEQPERLDLQAILANLYYSSNLLEKSIITCENLVEKIPYCMVANQILADSLPRVSRENEAAEYSQRLTELDPYSAYLSDGTQISNAVDDQSVTLEKLDLTTSDAPIEEFGLTPLIVNNAAIPKAGVEEWLVSIKKYQKSQTDNLQGEITAAPIIGSQAIQSQSGDIEIPLQGTEPVEYSVSEKKEPEIAIDYNFPPLAPAKNSDLDSSLPHPPASKDDLSQITPELPVLSNPKTVNEIGEEEFQDLSEPPAPLFIGETADWFPEHPGELESDVELDQLNAQQSLEDGFEESNPVAEILIEREFPDSVIKDDGISGEEIHSEADQDLIEPIDGVEAGSSGWIPIDTSESTDTEIFENLPQEPPQESPALEDILTVDKVILDEGSNEEITQPVYPAKLETNPPQDQVYLEEEIASLDEIPVGGTTAVIKTPGYNLEAVPPIENEAESLEKKAGFLAWLHTVKSTVREEINEQILPKWLQSGKPSDNIQVPEMSDLIEQPLQEEITGIVTPQIIEPVNEPDQTVNVDEENEGIKLENIIDDHIDEDKDEKDQLNILESSLQDLDNYPSDLEHPKFTEEFDRAHTDIEQQNFGKAAERYHKLMKNNKNLLRVISSLEEAVQNNPEEIDLIQTLGDAYVRSGRLQDALDIYTKAEELLK